MDEGKPLVEARARTGRGKGGGLNWEAEVEEEWKKWAEEKEAAANAAMADN